MTGDVLTFNARRGYGFIDDGKEVYFFHRSDLFVPVRAGDRVSFDGCAHEKGLRAYRIRRVSSGLSDR